MAITDKKVTEATLGQQGVISAPDRLQGTADENKRVFDRLIRTVVAQSLNPLIDELAGIVGAENIGAKDGETQTNVQAMLTALQTAADGKADVENVLTKDNNTPYTPTGAYHPATKQFVEDVVNTSGSLTPEQIALVNQIPQKAGRSTMITATLIAEGWVGEESPFTQTVTVEGVTESSINELIPPLGATAQQLKALQAANIQDGGQTVNSITYTAWGKKPEMDLPVRIIIRGDL